jgi:hypothetical protein
MFQALKKLLTRTHPLVELGSSGDSSELARTFGQTELILLSIPIPDSIDPTTLTQQELLDLIEKAAEEVAQQEDFVPFTYESESKHSLPVFTSEKAARVFVNSYVAEVNMIIPFEVAALPGKHLAGHLDESACVIVNPRSPSEYELSPSDVQEIIRLWA